MTTTRQPASALLRNFRFTFGGRGAQSRYGPAALLVGIRAGIAGNVDSLIRPLVYKRISNIHPMITLVGAFAGVRYFGLLGLILGPLAIAYLFELLRFYREEYGGGNEPVDRSTTSLTTPAA